MTAVAVIQSNYIPWKGYFDIIHDVDLFVFYDDVQYTKNDWRNRNRVKTANGLTWLTIPVGAHNDKCIDEIRLADQRWQSKHWATLQQAYSRAPFFSDYRDFWAHVYLESDWPRLSELNQFLIKTISKEMLGVQVEFEDVRSFRLGEGRVGRLLDLLRQIGATRYVSGPTARDYLDVSRFAEAGIQVVFKDYAGYPAYPQPFPPFEHAVSILDLLFCCGPRAAEYIWGWRTGDAVIPSTLVGDSATP